MTDKVYDQREDLWEARKQAAAKEDRSTTFRLNVIKLSGFLEALDEWGCVDNDERAEAILEFQEGGYDLSSYKDMP